MLLRLGCRVPVAEDGAGALECILVKPNDVQDAYGLSPYAVVFLDNQMPVLSGEQVVATLRRLGRTDFVVGITGTAISMGEQEAFLHAG
ncbi:hypothetical protein BD413DRAFT_578804 [Trametes elegans]|nr:hypothetical protein BD413DRAFT_578804 [Trametes elegans]